MIQICRKKPHSVSEIKWKSYRQMLRSIIKYILIMKYVLFYFIWYSYFVIFMEVLCWAPPSIKLENLTSIQTKNFMNEEKSFPFFKKWRKITSHDGIKFQLV